MNIKKNTLFTRVMALMCMLCVGQAFGMGIAQIAAGPSYYVRANGDDGNDGLSEAAPFKTLKKAVYMAAAGTVKTITVIGPVDGGCTIVNAGNPEILITGKPGASDTEKALILGGGTSIISSQWGGSHITNGISISNSKVRFTHIQIRNMDGRGLAINEAEVTLGASALITGCNNNNDGGSSPNYNLGAGVGLVSGTLNMTDNAAISGNTASGSSHGGGIYVDGGILNMTDNATISGNTADEGGGVFVLSMCKINMTGNAAISGNIAANGGGVYIFMATSHGESIIEGGKIQGNTAWGQGGGIYVEWDENIIENVTVSGNKAWRGGGVYIGAQAYSTVKLTVTGGKITGNEAESAGGGVYVEKGAAYESVKGASVTGNKAGDGEGENVFRE
jgi:hypothetical protein